MPPRGLGRCVKLSPRGILLSAHTAQNAIMASKDVSVTLATAVSVSTGRVIGLASVGDEQQQQTQKQKQPGPGGNLREQRDTRQAAAAALVPPDPREPKPLSLMVTNLPLRMRSVELKGLFRGFSVSFACSSPVVAVRTAYKVSKHSRYGTC